MIKPVSSALISSLLSLREGEIKFGERVGYWRTGTPLPCADNSPFRFALLGIEEDTGPRANHGRAGADKAWQATLAWLLNLQSNAYLTGEQILVAGSISLTTPQDEDIQALRNECQQWDQQVESAVKELLEAGLIPIIIGGGHNNALGIIRACAEHTNSRLAIANIDPHSDFRNLEGRHSGNPFHYAYEQGCLGAYTVIGLHEQKNTHQSLQALSEAHFPTFSMQSIYVRKEHSLEQVIAGANRYLTESQLPVGLEIDVDAISQAPSSAMTFCGMPYQDVLWGVDHITRAQRLQYIHIAEAAPDCHPAGFHAGARDVGQLNAELICTFVKAYQG